MRAIKRLSLAIAVLVMSVTGVSKADQPLKPGTVFRDCAECPEMVVVPPGLFIMGIGGTIKREGPPHRVVIKKPFAIGVFEITFDQWEACRADGGCEHYPDDHDWGRGDRPVVNVTMAHVENYLAWISRKTGHRYRLPSEAEWEYAHRAGTTTRYPWGDKAGKNRANCKDCYSKWSAKSTAPVGSFQPNAFGLHDTFGNAYEWTADCWNPTHEGANGDGSARTDGDCRQRVMKGGSFYYFQKAGRASYRAKNPAVVNSYWLGFRVVKEF